MSDQYCGGCRHWRPTTPGESWEFDISQRPWGHCLKIHAVQEDAADLKTDIAVTVDGSAYYSRLHTTAGFGCVLWGRKEP